MAKNKVLTRKQQNRREIMQAISDAAKLYKEYLVGRTFLYVFDNRYIEVLYKKANFKHLTGVESFLSANEFFKLAIQRKLQTNQISFSARHPYQLCRRKIKHINEIAHLAQTESFMLEEITTQSKTYKFGTTDLNFSLCLDKEYNTDGTEKSTYFVAQSLRDEDCFSKSKNVYDVAYIFRKKNDEKLYHELLYQDKRYVSLPNSVKLLLDNNLDDTLV